MLGRTTPYRPRWNPRTGLWETLCCSILLCQFLQQPLEQLKSYIEHCKDCVAAFLRAFFDGERSIRSRDLKAYNTNLELLTYIQYLLRRHFGIQTTGPHRATASRRRFRSPTNGKLYKNKKPCCKLYVRACDLPLFFQTIGFTIKRKQHRLISAIKNPLSFSFSYYVRPFLPHAGVSVTGLLQFGQLRCRASHSRKCS